MSEKMKKEEVKNSAMKSFLKNSVGKLAILAAAATSLSSCNYWAFSHHSRHGSFRVGGDYGAPCYGVHHGGCGGHRVHRVHRVHRGGCGGTHTHYCSNGHLYYL